MDFASFNKFSSNTSEAFKQSTKTKDYTDKRFWKLSIDEGSSNAQAIIRFLPSKDPEKNILPYVKIFSHFFRGDDGKWCISKCPRSFNTNERCPICEANRILWKIEPSMADTLRTRKGKATYISNILVVKDYQHPENDGKVFLYKYTSTIFNMITSALEPEFNDDKLEPFDLMNGNNLIIRLRYDQAKKSPQFPKGMPTTDKSTWVNEKSAIVTNEEEFNNIWSQMVDLDEYNNEEHPTASEIQSKVETAYHNTIHKIKAYEATGAVISGSGSDLNTSSGVNDFVNSVTSNFDVTQTTPPKANFNVAPSETISTEDSYNMFQQLVEQA